MSTSTLTPTRSPAVSVGVAPPTCEFDAERGIWHLDGGHDSFYSVSLSRALDHARAIYGPTPVRVTSTDAELDRLVAAIDRCETTAGSAAAKDKLLRYIDANEVPLGRDDISSLVDLPTDSYRVGSILDGWEPVVVAAADVSSPTDRVVAAVVAGDRMVTVLDGERRRNQRLLEAGALFVRCAADDWAPSKWTIDSVTRLSAAERQRIERATSAPLAVANLEIQAHRSDKREAFVVPVASPADISSTAGVVGFLADKLDRPVEYVFAVEPGALFPQDVDALVEEVEAVGRAGRIDASARLIVADAVDEALLEACRDRLTCMKTHATPFGSNAFVGSHAAALLEVSRRPVVLIGPSVDATKRPTFEAIAIALGGDIDEVGLFGPARRLADDLGVATRWIHIVTPDDENVIVDEAGDTRFWYPGSARTTLPVDAIVADSHDSHDLGRQLVEATADSMLAMSTHARRGLNRVANGSVTFDAAEIATQPVLVVGPDVGAPDAPPRTGTETTVVATRSAIHELLAARGDFHEPCDLTYHAPQDTRRDDRDGKNS